MPTPPGTVSKDKDGDKTPKNNRKALEQKQRAARGGKNGLNKKDSESQPLKNVASVSSLDSEAAKMFVCRENVEKDDAELTRQVESSWAQRAGFPTKSGLVMAHGVTIQRNERQATVMMKENAEYGSASKKIRTKGRFQIGIPTNGLLNRTDMAWAHKANPVAHAAQMHREQLDIKMLQKKKKSRELSNMLVQFKGGNKKGQIGAANSRTT